MFKRFEINGKEVIAENRFSAIASSIIAKHKVKAETVDFGETEADVTSQLTFVVKKDVDEKPLLRLLAKKGLLIINFKEGVEVPSVVQILEPKNRKYTEKVGGNGEYKQVRIKDGSSKSLEALDNAFKLILSVFEYSDSVELCNISYDGKVTKLTLDYDISNVELT